MIEILLPIAVLTNGLAAGGSVLSVLGGAPLMLSLPVDRYVYVHQFLERRMHPFMPACLLIALAADVAGAVLLTDGALFLLILAALLLIGAIAVSVLKNVPINRAVSRLDPERLPFGYDGGTSRARWSKWNRVRSALIVLALVAEVTSVGVRLR